MNNISKESYTLANWTGIAVRAYTGAEEIDMRIRRRENIIVPAMPDDLWKHDDTVFKFIIKETQTWELWDDENFQFLDQRNIDGMNRMKDLLVESFMVRWEVDRVPLKPNPESPQVPNEYKEAIKQAPDTLANFYPKGVFPHNIGSNEGIVWFLKNYYEDFIQDNPERKYNVITCDENIYKRAMRVFLSLPSLYNCSIVFT